MSTRIASSLSLIVLLVLCAACTTDVPPQPVPTATVDLAVTSEASPIAPPEGVDVTLTPTLPPPATGTGAPASTLTATATVTRRPTAAATRRPVSRGPLAFTYEVVGLQAQPDNSAILTLRIVATGGNGRYTYYHDDVKQAAATFNVPGHCGKPFVHTLKVISTDGQSVTQEYFINGVCATPTP